MTMELEDRRPLQVASEPVRYDQLVLPDRVHSRVYNDMAIFEDELRKIFYRGWVYIAHDSEIPKPGDYVARKIGRQPVIISRGKDGKVHVLMNRCPHRGNTVCLDDGGHTDSFRCAYHGWNFEAEAG